MTSRTPGKEKIRPADENLKHYVLKPLAAMLINAATGQQYLTGKPG